MRFKLQALLICTCALLLKSAYCAPTRISWDGKYDFIIVGGGTAGCVLAARLSENKRHSVLLLEAGPSDQTPYLEQIIDTPLALEQLANPALGAEWGFYSESQVHAAKALLDQKNRVYQGRVLGGTSSINGLLYIRGSKYDFDFWRDLGLNGWSYEDVLPYFKKSENNQDPEIVGDGTYHGTTGPWFMESRNFTLANIFVEAGIDLGYKGVDLNGADSTGFMQFQSNIRIGRRQSTAKAFLRPVLLRKNLHVKTLSQAVKIITKGRKAVGVQYMDLMTQTMHFVKAKKEVIISAGVFNSPKLLMLSGIGPKEHLESMGIQSLVDLPVGRVLEDHHATDLSFSINESISFTTTKIASFQALSEYLFSGTGYWSTSAAIATAKLMSDSQPPEDKFPYISIEQIGGYFAESPARQSIINFDPQFFTSFHSAETLQEGMVFLPGNFHPKSTGRVELRSPNPFDDPKIIFNTLEKSEDVQIMLDAIRKCQALVNTESFQKIGARLSTPHHPMCLNYTLDSDEYWECYMRHNTWTLYHYTSTCRMGPDGDEMSVVDDNLRVRGVEKLRVVDASVMPHTVSANTMSTVVMIAEKAADMIKQTYQ